MDALSYMLATVQLRTAIYATVWLRPPWGVRIPPARAAAFHAVIAGQCWFRLDNDEPPTALGPGDVVVLPHGDEHVFCDDLRSPVRTIDLSSMTLSEHIPRPPRDASANDPAATTVLCGHFWFEDETANPLVAMLPPLLRFRSAASGPPRGWLEPMLQFVALETDHRTPGGDAVLARLSDVIVIQAIRAHLAELPLRGQGWLHALADQQLGAALALIHEHPEMTWTIERLASDVGLSRSSFALRFTEVVGEAPLQYITRWRMHHAQRLLRASNASLTEVAEHVGYATEPAFSRAFKRWSGVAPGEFRRKALSEIDKGDEGK